MNEQIKAEAREILRQKRNRGIFYALAKAVSLLFFSWGGFMAAEVIRVAAPPPLRPLLTAVAAGLLLFGWLFFSAGLEQYGCRLFAEGLPNAAKTGVPFSLRYLPKAVWLKIVIGFRRTLAFCAWSALPLGLTALLFWCMACRTSDKEAMQPLWAGVIAVGGISLVFFLLHSERYCCAPYLLAASPAAPVGEILRRSKANTQGAERALFRFRLSFFPWLFLCALGVPLLFVIPYYKQSEACYIFTV